MPQTRSRLLSLALLLATALVLAACGTAGDGNGDGNGNGGDDGDGDAVPTDASRMGWVNVREAQEPTTGNGLTATASFVHLESDLPAGTDPYDRLIEGCYIHEGNLLTDIPFLDMPFEYVGAGDDVVLHGPDETAPYATLERHEETFGDVTQIVYQPPEETTLESPIPSDLAATVPGSDAFPAFDGVALPNAPTFELAAPADGTVDGDTVFTWTGADTADRSIVTFLITFEEGPTMTCGADADDGTFTIPDETMAEVESGATGSLIYATRVTYDIAVEGDAILLLTNEYAVGSGF